VKDQDQILLRQFLLFFVLPLFIIIIGSVIAVNIYSNRQTTIMVNESQNNPLNTQLNDYLAEVEVTLITQEGKESDDQQGIAQTKSTSSPTPKPKQPLAVKDRNILFYAGLIICGGILVIIIGAGVFFILMPTKNSQT